MQFINLFNSSKLMLPVIIFVIFFKVLLDWICLLVFSLFNIFVNRVEFGNMLVAVFFKQRMIDY